VSYGKVIREHPFGVNMGTTIQLTYTVEIAEEDIEYMKYADLTLEEWVNSRVYISGVDVGIGQAELKHLPEYIE
jgi:hypothetical protein